jgi:ribose transport system substrate-binding protein
MDAIKKYPGIKIISSDQYAGATRDSAYQAAQNLLTRFGKDVNGIFTPNESTVIGTMMALRDLNKAGGVVKLVGFDTGAQSVDGLKKGDVQGLVVQNPMRMGYLGVITIMDHLKGKPVVKRIDTGVQVVTQENMNKPEIQDLLVPPLKEYLN